MKKKLLVLPIITLIFTSLAGCNLFKPAEVDPIYIDSWLECATTPENNPNASTFWLKDETDYSSLYDYGLVVRDAIKEKVKEIAPKKVKEQKTTDGDYAGYQIRDYVGRFTACSIFVFDDGTIASNNYGSGWGAPKSQHFVYDIGKEASTELLAKIKARYFELKTALDGEYAATREVANVDNFFKSIEESSENPTINYRETRGDQEVYTFTTQDEDHSILSGLKELEYQALDSYSLSLLPMVKYYINEDWQLQIYCGYNEAHYDIATIQYKYNGEYKHYYSTYYIFYYSINPTKTEALVDIIRNKQASN